MLYIVSYWPCSDMWIKLKLIYKWTYPYEILLYIIMHYRNIWIQYVGSEMWPEGVCGLSLDSIRIEKFRWVEASWSGLLCSECG